MVKQWTPAPPLARARAPPAPPRAPGRRRARRARRAAQARQVEAHGRAWAYEAATLVRGARLEAETRALGGRDAVEVAMHLQVGRVK